MSTIPHSLFYQSYVNPNNPAWQALRKLVFDRSGGRCERCSDLAPLQCHHKHYDTLGWERLP